MRIAILSSFNVDLLPQRLEQALGRAGLPDAEVVLGEFGQIALEALGPDSQALSPTPDAVVVIPAVEDVTNIWDLQDAIRALLDRTATIYVVVFGAEHLPNAHVLNPVHSLRGQRKIESFLHGVNSLASPRVVPVDWNWHSRRHDYFDPRLWYLARMRLNPTGLDALADLIAVHIAAHAGIVRKVLAVDLDGTLWGGIIGEDGMSGIVVGEDGIGLAYQDFQRELLAIRDTGVLLVACSKNNDADALEVFDKHPGMIIRRDNFTTARIGWHSKPESLASMVNELGLGLDSFVFLDDEPREREYVRQALPDIIVPDLPADPTRRPQFLRDLTCFRRISLTQADVNRHGDYIALGARKKAQVGLTLGEYIRSLEQEIDIRPVDQGSIARAAQLCQRTNQFTTTTKRYTVAQLESMLAVPDTEAFTVSVRDRFGDSGIVGLAILDFETIDTFLLSCRVLGRGIEDTLLAFLVRHARESGLLRLIGRYVPTAKNAPAADLYRKAGFVPLTTECFSLDLTREPAHA